MQELQDLEKQLEALKDQAPTGTGGGGGGGGDGSLDDRLEKLQADVGLLANSTDNIVKSLEGSVHLVTSTTHVCAQVQARRARTHFSTSS